MGTTTAAISIDRFRRRRAAAADSLGPASVAHPLSGTVLGTIERRYGLMTSEEQISIAEVIATSGDLAVADRLAFIASMERHVAVAVVEVEGWYVACTTERAMAPDELRELRPLEDSPRIMSMASERGITPALGPLGA
jgi:hypothetical protein